MFKIDSIPEISKIIKIVLSSILSVAICFFASAGLALEPHEILVIANRNSARSVGLAEYYMKKRNIPNDNLLKLWLTDKELCSRDEYNRKVARRVRKHLLENDKQRRIRCLLVMYGMPLKVAPPEMTAAEKTQIQSLRKKQETLTKNLKNIGDRNKERTKVLKKDLQSIKNQITQVAKTDQRSSLDSELALVLTENYSLHGWIPNALYIGFQNEGLPKEGVLPVCRLDGPTSQIVKRIIDDSLATEEKGIVGTAYFDARTRRPDSLRKPNTQNQYLNYDRSLYMAAQLVTQGGRLPVVVNDKPELFKPGECPNAVLYSGWYSHAKYVDAFAWQKGAVGYHIASSECSTLKSKKSQVWCKRMLEEGIAATLGPTSEPYLQAFPLPEIFFGLLLDGRLSLIECYALSNPYWSWQMVLIGDPLYRPFKNAGKGG